MDSKVPTPQEIAAFLARRVIGQAEAITEISIALAKRLGHLPVGNVLMIGASGTGKTTLMRAVEDYLAEATAFGALRPIVVRLHANVLGEEAEQGRPGDVLLLRLLERAREVLGATTPVETLLEHARRGLVFVDEIDKIRTHVTDQINTAGIRAQEALLTVMENEAIPFTLPAWAGGTLRVVDSSGLLFVCACKGSSFSCVPWQRPIMRSPGKAWPRLGSAAGRPVECPALGGLFPPGLDGSTLIGRTIRS